MKIRSVKFSEDLNFRSIDFTISCKREFAAPVFPVSCLWFKWVHAPFDTVKDCYNCAFNNVDCPHFKINLFIDEVFNMNEKQKRMTAEFIGQVAYIIGKRGKKGAVDYLAKNTALSVKSAKSIVDSVCKLYDEGGEIHD